MAKIVFGDDGSEDQGGALSWEERVSNGEQIINEFRALPADLRCGLRAFGNGVEPIDGSPKESERLGTLEVKFLDSLGRQCGRLTIMPSGKTFVNPDLLDPDDYKNSPPSKLGETFLQAVGPIGFRIFKKRAA
jgi:hypothetical protein